MSAALPLLRAAAGGALLLTLAGCAAGRGFPRRPAPESLPPASPLRSATLPETDAWLRHYLVTGAYDSAVRVLDAGARTAPRDPLVRMLQLGVVLHQAGRHAESNDAFEWAEREAEERITRSVSRGVGSLVVNDGMLEYVPSPSERAMIPYYRMLNYLALGSRDESLVEARKASALLAERDTKAEIACDEAFLGYLSGLVYQAAGERNDALVSLRRSERAFDACGGEGEIARPAAFGMDLFRAASELGVREVADSARTRYRLDSGATAGRTADLVLLVEHGWVAHRWEQDVHVPVYPEEVDGVEEDDEAVAAAGRISARLLGELMDEVRWGEGYHEHPTVQVADALSGAHILRFAWPVYRLEASRPAELRVLVDDSVAAVSTVEDLSSRVVRDFERRRPMVITRAVGRGVLKYLAAREVERRAEKKGGEAAGFFAARLMNLAGNLLERADTRSWALLPDRISLARVVLPPGEHRVRIEVRRGGWSEAVDTLDLGVVTVQPGERVFRSRRVWGEEQGDEGRFGRWNDPRALSVYDTRWAGAGPRYVGDRPEARPVRVKEKGAARPNPVEGQRPAAEVRPRVGERDEASEREWRERRERAKGSSGRSGDGGVPVSRARPNPE
ncbi:MAG TPA: hypothetical protein VHG28_05195 [Longimicrobiaceae bacterium]|nr:hypothetical protein [Longimicrobiaceae bacterium]